MSKLSNSRDQLLQLAESKGFLVYDDIMDVSDIFELSVSEVDELSEAIQLRGIIVYEETPTKIDIQDESVDYSRVSYETIFDEIETLSENLNYIVSYARIMPTPQHGELSTLFVQCRNGNKFARERIIHIHMRLALKIAVSLCKQRDYDIEDAVSAGLIGLCAAVDRFDPNGFSVFQSYAAMWIQQNIQRECTPVWMEYYFPAHYKEKLFLCLRTYRSNFGKYDTMTENPDDEKIKVIVNGTGLSFNEVKDCFEVIFNQMKGRLSFDEIKYEENDTSKETIHHGLLYGENLSHLHKFLIDTEHDPLKVLIEEDLRTTIKNVLETLSNKEKEVIMLRYGLDNHEPHTLEEIGSIYGITRERVRQIEAKALRKLNNPIRSSKLRVFY